MRKCNFPQNIIELFELEFKDGSTPSDFTATLYYLLHEENARSGAMFWQYYTTEATYEEIGALYGVGRETVRQAVTKQTRRLKHPSRRIMLETGLSRCREAREKELYERGYTDGYRDCSKAMLGEDIENAPKSEGIECLELSVRAFNILRRGGIRTVGDIIRTKPEELSKLQGMGKKSYEEIVNRLVERCGEKRERWEAPL